MKTTFLICILFLFSCHGKGKNGAPVDAYDSGKDSTKKPDSTIITQIANKDTSAAYLARVKGNQKPIASAGADQIITIATVTLNGSASKDPDGKISKYLWVQEKGTLVTITNNTAAVATVKNITNGEYRFRLTVTDNTFATASDTVHISVKKVIVIPPPVDTTKPKPPVDTVIVVPPVTTTRNNLDYEATLEGTGFEIPAISGSGNQWFYETGAATIGAAWSVNGVNAPVKSGTGAVRFELRKTDATTSNTTSARSELTLKYAPGSYYESWMGFSVYLPSASYGTDQAADIIHQIHANNGESPPFAIQTQNGKWQVAYNWDNGGSVQYHTIDLGIPYEKDQWVDFVYHIKLSKGTDGFIELWKNGVKIWTYNGQTQYTNVSGNNFYRIGIYKWAWTQGIASSQTVRVAYYDEVRIGNANATYNDVAPSKN